MCDRENWNREGTEKLTEEGLINAYLISPMGYVYIYISLLGKAKFLPLLSLRLPFLLSRGDMRKGK